MAIKTGDAVGDYRVMDLAGAGGMGAVYRIEHVITKRIEAMKVLPGGIGSGPEDVQRFEREIQVQARLHHPNIAALYNAVHHDGSIALIMEYVEGESLQRILERGPLPLHTAVDFAGQVLDALAYAHQKGVIHRDVAPANIIITPEGIAKLTDFGLARAATDLRLTTSGVAVGSAWYMSPEQVRGGEELDARTDIYAMGAVLHEMLTGRKLFDASGSFAVMRAQTETVPRPPSAYNPQVSTAVDQVAARALAKNPAARFQTAGEFHLALGAARGEAANRKPAARAGMALIVSFAGLAAAICAVLVWHNTASVPPPARVKWEATLPAPLPEPAPERAAVVPAPASPAPSRRRVVKQAFVAPPPAPPVPISHPTTLAPVPEPRAPEPAEAAPPAPAPSNASAEPTPATPAPEEVKPKKTGNRFGRVLRKLNPFRKGGESAEPVKATAIKE